MNTTTDYTKQAQDFLTKTGVKCSIKYKEYGKHFDDDKEKRNIYRVTLRKGKNSYSFNFGDSIARTQRGAKPNEYDVLVCLTKYEPGTFENFCGDFGYDTDSRRAEKTYKAVLKEYAEVCRIWTEAERAELAEIN